MSRVSFYGRSAASAIAAAVLGLVCQSALADDVQLKYTGKDFIIAASPFTLSDSVSIVFTLTGPLAPNSFYGAANIVSYTATDGVDTISGLGSNTSLSFLEIFTGPTENIYQWDISVRTANGSNVTQTSIETLLLGAALDQGNHLLANGTYAVGANAASPGTWTVLPSVPEPNGAALLALGLVALGAMNRGHSPRSRPVGRRPRREAAGGPVNNTPPH